MRDIARQRLLHGVKDEHWTTLLKTPTFVWIITLAFWSIFILFELMETGMYT